jgi:ubiquinone/menaquinone biosynthesis C-methylase UbiE
MNSVGECNESNRVAWLEKILATIPEKSRILDAGAGEKQFQKFCSHLDYVAQDFAGYNGQGNNKGLQTGSWDQALLDIVSDITAIPEPDDSFEAIMCVEVFEHLPEPLLALKEFSRLLRPDGYLIITAPFCSLTHLAPYHFYTGFNRYFYEHHLPNYGFNIVEIKENGNFFEYLAQETNRISSVAKRYTVNQAKIYKWEKLAIKVFMKMLGRLSLQDRGSSELLHFGCHVLARKIGVNN